MTWELIMRNNRHTLTHSIVSGNRCCPSSNYRQQIKTLFNLLLPHNTLTHTHTHASAHIITTSGEVLQLVFTLCVFLFIIQGQHRHSQIRGLFCMNYQLKPED